MGKRKNSVDLSATRPVKVEIIEKKNNLETPFLGN